MGKVIVRLTLKELKKRLGMEGKNIEIESVFFRHDIYSIDMIINGPYLPEPDGELETNKIDDLIETTQFRILTRSSHYYEDKKNGFGFPNPFYKALREEVIENIEQAREIYKYIFNNFVREWSTFNKEYGGNYIIKDEWRELVI